MSHRVIGPKDAINNYWKKLLQLPVSLCFRHGDAKVSPVGVTNRTSLSKQVGVVDHDCSLGIVIALLEL